MEEKQRKIKYPENKPRDLLAGRMGGKAGTHTPSANNENEETQWWENKERFTKEKPCRLEVLQVEL